MSTCGCGGDSNGPHRSMRIQSPGGGRAGYPHVDVAHVRRSSGGELVEHRERGGTLRHDVLEAAEPHLLRRGLRPARVARRGCSTGSPCSPGQRRDLGPQRRREQRERERGRARARSGSPAAPSRCVPSISGRPTGGVRLVAEHATGRVDERGRRRRARAATRRGAGRRTQATGARSTTVIVQPVRQLASTFALATHGQLLDPARRPHRCRRTAAPSRRSRLPPRAPPPGSRGACPGS